MQVPELLILRVTANPTQWGNAQVCFPVAACPGLDLLGPPPSERVVPEVRAQSQWGGRYK